MPFYLAILRSILLIRELFFPSTLEATAQSAAGSQPMMVIWSSKHRIPLSIFPLRKNDNQGTKTAINNIAFSFFCQNIYQKGLIQMLLYKRQILNLNTWEYFIAVFKDLKNILKKLVKPNSCTYICNQIVSYYNAKRYFPSHSRPYQKSHHSLDSLTSHDTQCHCWPFWQ